ASTERGGCKRCEGVQRHGENSKMILPLRFPCAAWATAALNSLSGYDFSIFVFNRPLLAMANSGPNAAIRSAWVALSYHWLIQIPRKRRSLKMSNPVGIFSGCKLIAPNVTMVDPGARQLARRSALSPPTA